VDRVNGVAHQSTSLIKRGSLTSRSTAKIKWIIGVWAHLILTGDQAMNGSHAPTTSDGSGIILASSSFLAFGPWILRWFLSTASWWHVELVSLTFGSVDTLHRVSDGGAACSSPRVGVRLLQGCSDDQSQHATTVGPPQPHSGLQIARQSSGARVQYQPRVSCLRMKLPRESAAI
jgi:hypothetical protein